MVKQVVRWEAENGKLFDTKQEAEDQDKVHNRFKLMKEKLSYEIWSYHGEEIYEFIEQYTKGWK